jgi:guanine nucleotide-binding protein subunit alpha
MLWRAVVQLNLVRNILVIMSAMQTEMSGESSAADERGASVSHEFSDKHQILLLQLSPLRQVERDLKRRLGAGSEELRLAVQQPTFGSPFEASRNGSTAQNEFAVRSWRDALSSASVSTLSEGSTTEVIAGCRLHIQTLWEDQAVQDVLRRRNVKLEEKSGL